MQCLIVDESIGLDNDFGKFFKKVKGCQEVYFCMIIC